MYNEYCRKFMKGIVMMIMYNDTKGYNNSTVATTKNINTMHILSIGFQSKYQSKIKHH